MSGTFCANSPGARRARARQLRRAHCRRRPALGVRHRCATSVLTFEFAVSTEGKSRRRRRTGAPDAAEASGANHILHQRRGQERRDDRAPSWNQQSIRQTRRRELVRIGLVRVRRKPHNATSVGSWLTTRAGKWPTRRWQALERLANVRFGVLDVTGPLFAARARGGGRDDTCRPSTCCSTTPASCRQTS